MSGVESRSANGRDERAWVSASRCVDHTSAASRDVDDGSLHAVDSLELVLEAYQRGGG